MDIHTDYDLSSYNSFAVPSRARGFCIVKDRESLEGALAYAAEQNLSLFILGGGSNVLFTADFPGLVIHIALSCIEIQVLKNDQVELKLGAGENWHQIVMYCIQNNLYGIENLALIPGTVGAAPIQNIGAYGVELAKTFQSLEAVEISSGKLLVMSKSDCDFGYRDSIFKRALANQLIITSVTLGLSSIAAVTADYGALKDEMGKLDADIEVTPKHVAAAVMAIRQRKLPDPGLLPNAGSFFKNPLISLTKYEDLRQQYDDVPSFRLPGVAGQVKVPAAWLLDQSGWKGRKQGAVGVHEHQAVVIVNYGGASGAEVLRLARDMQQSIQDDFGIALEPEVKII